MGDGNWELVERWENAQSLVWENTQSLVGEYLKLGVGEYSSQASLSIQRKYDSCVRIFWGFWTLLWEDWNCGNHSPINSRQALVAQNFHRNILRTFSELQIWPTQLEMKARYVLFPHCWYVWLLQDSVTWIPKQSTFVDLGNFEAFRKWVEVVGF